MNEKTKVLIITYYWPPSGGAGVQRWVKFAKYLPEFNIEPFVLTVENGTYPLVDNSLNKEVSSALPVFRSKSIEPYSLFAGLTGKTDKEVSTPSTAFSSDGSLLKKIGIWVRANFFIPDARIGWIPFALKKAESIISENGIKQVITTGPPNSTHLIGLKLKTKYPDLNWIMDMRDPWSQIFYNQQLPRTDRASKKDISLEKKCLTKADEVIVVSDSMNKVQQNVFSRHYHTITNGFDHDDFELTNDKNKLDTLSIKYVGSMTEAAIPHSFFKALSSLDDDMRIKISVSFFGSFNEKVKEIINRYELQDLISYHGYIPHKAAKKEMQTADLLLLVIPDTEDNELIITGKIFDYIGAQKPILCIGPENGDASNLIIENNLGENFSYHEREAITRFLIDQLSGNEYPYKIWTKDFKLHPFSRFNLTKKLSDLINSKESTF
ncbi:MAG: hypothetical protein JJ892_12465 [Balneola sp.]|nr:hypothetical protein [Balneola sp.]MBO6651091.1 hypothetical protein [Balneola sp.]MBO6712783.1 hypothetical protein [Balneola sp.]MBO6801082.1 hypothetical protein [Balneola sp.]MBO6871274.1 hypothetical protein [Balneola sp.]